MAQQTARALLRGSIYLCCPWCCLAEDLDLRSQAHDGREQRMEVLSELLTHLELAQRGVERD